MGRICGESHCELPALLGLEPHLLFPIINMSLGIKMTLNQGNEEWGSLPESRSLSDQTCGCDLVGMLGYLGWGQGLWALGTQVIRDK